MTPWQFTFVVELKRLYPKGCQPPHGYCAWLDWARAQGAHGLKQTQCWTCARWCLPQELSHHDCNAFLAASRKGGRAKGLGGRRGGG